MRSLFLAALIFAWLPFIIFKPHIGVLVWDWMSHMNPQFQTYGFARDFQFLDIVAALTVLGVFISRDRARLPGHPLVVLMVVYLLWTVITTVFGWAPALSMEKLIHLGKVMGFALIAVMVMQSENRLKAFFYVMVASMAYTAVKGGLFTLVTGGSVGRVQGAGGMMIDNNHLAMAMTMMVPLVLYLVYYPPHRLLRLPMLGLLGLFILAVLGTHSRGGFVALAAVMGMLLIKTKRKVAIVGAVLPLALIGLSVMPESWTQRMSTIDQATEDSSFRGRLESWRFATNFADDHVVSGGGFDIFYVRRARELYDPPGGKIGRAAHSIYFEVLAEHGYVGLFLFLSLLFTGWFAGGHVARHFRAFEETLWVGDMASMLQVGLLGYAVGGLTVNIATFDLFYHFLGLIVMCSVVGDRTLALSDGGTVRRHFGNDAELALPRWRPKSRADGRRAGRGGNASRPV
ncbi:putative O-glycosylation ligase, exosortase A system-associated [Yunchengibacter salinarum]|uniref:putative O-glycosylation ligase, exosortase A system-associated n=1 Tax=Yunchengibacter salinarum TaxID=3133399 RepID=UPI0035B63E1A